MVNDARNVFYKMMWSDTLGGVAYAPSSFELWLEPNIELLKDWHMPTFQLRDGPFDDYLANNTGLPLCSKKMLDVLEAQRDKNDLVEWLPVQVQAENEQREYFILHLLEELDVVNQSKSIVNVRGGVVRLHLNLLNVGAHHLFKYKGSGNTTVCLSNRLRLALIKESCTGCHYWEIPAS
ncbi:MAG TPA: DUF1629 domain-containing protein [Chloroflexia bacterium]|nr:DUF1629 domain-containing protein [Chloroflexia bacterium]